MSGTIVIPAFNERERIETLANLTGQAGKGRMARMIGNRLPRVLDMNSDNEISEAVEVLEGAIAAQG